MTLDGVVSDPQNWANITDEILQDGIDYYNSVDISVFGSRTYPGMVEYWTNAEKNSASAKERAFAAQLNNKKKMVLSRSQVDLTWKNSEHLPFTDAPSFAREIENLRNATDHIISVESGIGTWKVFLENNLFDGLLVFIEPVLVGKGEKLLGAVDIKKTGLELENSRTFQGGIVCLAYGKQQ